MLLYVITEWQAASLGAINATSLKRSGSAAKPSIFKSTGNVEN